AKEWLDPQQPLQVLPEAYASPLHALWPRTNLPGKAQEVKRYGRGHRKAYWTSGCTGSCLRQKPFSLKPPSFLIGNMMMATGFHYIIQQSRNWYKPAIFLAKPFHEQLKLCIHTTIIKALAEMGIHNTCAVFFL